MVQDDEIRQSVTIYEIDDKKYTVITKCVEDVQNMNKLYDVICKYAISQL